jgi:hypothetical protein
MNEQQLAAVKQAVEALEKSLPRLAPYGEQDWLDSCKAITALQSIISQDALYKMAEDAVTIGLSYNDWPKIGCVNHDCDKCKAVQEPVAIVVVAEYEDGSTAGHRLEWRGRNEANDFPEGTEFYTAPQPVPVKTYHDGKPWPVAPKFWVGLTDEEVVQCQQGDVYHFYRCIEAKLKEKNT